MNKNPNILSEKQLRLFLSFLLGGIILLTCKHLVVAGILLLILAIILVYDDAFDAAYERYCKKCSEECENEKEVLVEDYDRYFYKFAFLAVIIFGLYMLFEMGVIPQTTKLYLPLVSLFLAPQLREYITNFREAIKKANNTQKPEENLQPSSDQASEGNDPQDPPKP